SILTDRVEAFESALMQQLCAIYGCRKVHTTPYHPQGNGACERFNRTLLSLLSTIEVKHQAQWPVHLPAPSAPTPMGSRLSAPSATTPMGSRLSQPPLPPRQ